MFLFINHFLDGFVKSPTSALCCISQSFNVRKVRLIITKFARLEFELFTKPSKSDFLRVPQSYDEYSATIMPILKHMTKSIQLYDITIPKKMPDSFL
jgi:hypothetical protein